MLELLGASLLFFLVHSMMYRICIFCVGVCLLHVIGKEDTFLQAYVANNLLHVFKLIFVFSCHAQNKGKRKSNCNQNLTANIFRA